MKNPDLVLIGEYDKASGDKLSKIYANILENKAPIERINLENAEIIKLSINTFVTTKISYANMLTSICHETPGANIDVVSQTLGLDSRIGAKYLKGGSPYGGPCFPRDNRAFVKMAKDKNIIAHLAKGTDKLNQDHLAFIIKLIQDIPSTIKKVGLLGLSYKPETSVTEESSGINLAKKLIQLKYEVSYYDPLVKEVELKKLSSKNLKSILQTNDVVIVLNNDKAYQKIRPSDIKDKIYILDCWRILNNKEWKKYLISLGVGKII
jgi:UDPglucose 6-dehydrogenase